MDMDREPIDASIAKFFLFILFVVIIYEIFTDSYKGPSREKTTVQLKSLFYNSQISGGFTLGTGHFEEKDYYVCYEILDDGGLQLFKLDANDTIIYETLDTQEAYVEISHEFNTKNKLYIPKNAIKVEYNFKP